VILKFLKPRNFFKELLPNYKGGYIQLCVPLIEDEKFAYVELTENQYPFFVEHFGEILIKLDNESDEYPASRNNKIKNRLEKFTVVRPEYRQKPF